MRKTSGPAGFPTDRGRCRKDFRECTPAGYVKNTWRRGGTPRAVHDLSYRSSFLGALGMARGTALTRTIARGAVQGHGPALSRCRGPSMQEALGALRRPSRKEAESLRIVRHAGQARGRCHRRASSAVPESAGADAAVTTRRASVTEIGRVRGWPDGHSRDVSKRQFVTFRRHSQCLRFVKTRALRSSKF